MQKNRRFIIVIAAVVLLAGALVAGLLLADTPVRASVLGDAEEDALEGEDRAISGDALERASQAALDYAGEGRVTGTEVGDEEGTYEIEITLDDGRRIDVHLDEAFNVLGEKTDGAGGDD